MPSKPTKKVRRKPERRCSARRTLGFLALLIALACLAPSGAAAAASPGDRAAKAVGASRGKCPTARAKPSKRSCRRVSRCSVRRARNRSTKRRSKRRKHCARRRARSHPRPPAPKGIGGAPAQPAAPAPVVPGASPEPPPPPGTTLGRYLSVSAREFSLTLSRPALAAGPVSIELRNTGEDPHNLVVSPEGSHAPFASYAEAAPGDLETQALDLPAGRYYLWCSLEGHEALGMSARLRVGS